MLAAALWLSGVWPRASAFPQLPSYYLVEIQVMMGSLVYLRLGLEKSPYCHLLDNSHWAEICETFTRDACSLLGLSVESPLSVRYDPASSTQRQRQGGHRADLPCAFTNLSWLSILPETDTAGFYG